MSENLDWCLKNVRALERMYETVTAAVCRLMVQWKAVMDDRLTVLHGAGREIGRRASRR